MTPAQIELLSVGTELDALVAQKVMGWMRCDYPSCQGWVRISHGGAVKDHLSHPSPYSTSDAAALEVVPTLLETLTRRDGARYSVHVQFEPNSVTVVVFVNGVAWFGPNPPRDPVYGQADRFALAFSRAALKAVL